MRRFGQVIGIGWSGFMASFLYYAVLTAAVLGGADLDLPWMATAYLLPSACLVALLLRQAVSRAGAAFQPAGQVELILHR